MASVDQLLADEAVSSSAAGEVLWPLADHLGTIRDIASHDSTTDVTTIENHRRYNAFGNLVHETNDTVDLLFGYTGRLWDEETQLQNNLNRWYDPLTGRWISEDPIGFAGGDTNLNRYVGNSPTNYLDPTGLDGFMTDFALGIASLYDQDTWTALYNWWKRDLPGDPWHGLPTENVGSWHPKDFFSSSPFSWKKRSWGCGGMAAFRILGDKGKQPSDFLSLPGVTAFSNFGQALNELHKSGGAMVAVENPNPFLLDGQPLSEGHALHGVPGSRIGITNPGSGNFATLLTSSYGRYWEWANHGWSSDPANARIRHGTTLPGDKHTLYFLIPRQHSKTCSLEAPRYP